MIEKTNTNKILELFADYPTKEFHIREIERILKISVPTVISSIEKLKKRNMILVEKSKALTKLRANIEKPEFISLKRIINLSKLYESGIINYLIEKYNYPEAIVLFGSYSLGEDIEKSDIDIAVITDKHIDLELDIYEKKNNRQISIHEINLSRISKEFLTNLCNGIVLYGYLTI